MTGLILPYQGIRPSIAESAFVAPDATIVGRVTIGAGTGIWYKCVLRGDVHEIRIGANTNVQDGTVIHVTTDRYGVYIGDDVTIGHMVLIHGATLEPGCFIGMRATIMDNCVVESGAMVAAGALLTPGKRVPKGQLWAGSPARPMRDLDADEIANFKRTADHYAELARDHRAAAEAEGGPGDTQSR